jgi:hypothetical protein
MGNPLSGKKNFWQYSNALIVVQLKLTGGAERNYLEKCIGICILHE